MGDIMGYRGISLGLIEKSHAAVGDIVELRTDWGELRGTIVPRYQYDDPDHLVIKLPSGYNIGVSVGRIRSLKRRSKGERPSFSPPPPPKARKDLPRVAIIATGGTIASRVDYRTGAVHPAISGGELYALIPELAEIAQIIPKVLLSVYSENIEPLHWRKVAEEVSRCVSHGYDGVVITHGTDTMGYTAAALSFALRGVPIPVVLVGAQRSSDRPSSDAILNLIGAVSVAARCAFSGVFVAMHEGEGDGRVAFHRGTRVRKNHTSARGAFESVGVGPAVFWSKSGIDTRDAGLPQRRHVPGFQSRPKFESKVALLKFYPSMPRSLLDLVTRSGIKGMVIEGSGLGHVSSKLMPSIRAFVKKDGVVCMTSQCIRGRVNMNVYETGRDLLSAGVIPLEDMLAETALVKLMWVLANTDSTKEAVKQMKTSLAGEVTERSLPG